MRRWRWLCGVAVIGLMLGAAPALALTPEQEQAIQSAATTGAETLRNQVRAVVAEELAKKRELADVVCEIMTNLASQPVSADLLADLAWAAVEGSVDAAVNLGIEETAAAEIATYAAVSGCARTDDAFVTAFYQRAAASPREPLRAGAADAAARSGSPSVVAAAEKAGLPVAGAGAVPGAPGAAGAPGGAAMALAARPFVPVGGGGGGVSSPERPASPAE